MSNWSNNASRDKIVPGSFGARAMCAAKHVGLLTTAQDAPQGDREIAGALRCKQSIYEYDARAWFSFDRTRIVERARIIDLRESKDARSRKVLSLWTML